MSDKNDHVLKSSTKGDGIVTVIIASYQRPNALNRALRSVYCQSYKKWRVLIVADCCSPDFVAKVDLSHERVSLVNLPVRCGNQYGPNSVGIYLADSEYIAFLNHDDLWLSDHLEKAIAVMQKESATFFIGKAAFCDGLNQRKWFEKTGRLVFSDLNKPEAIWRCIIGPNWYFEPASSWLIRAEFTRKVGYWQPPHSVLVTPVIDWLKRAARKGAKFCFSKDVTVMKFNLHHTARISKPLYSLEEPFAEGLNFFIGVPPEDIRRCIAEDMAKARERQLCVRAILAETIESKGHERYIKLFYYLYCKIGFLVPDKFLGAYKRAPGYAQKTLARRTGEHIDVFISPADLIRQIRQDKESDQDDLVC